MACDSCSASQEPSEDTNTPLTTPLPESTSNTEEFPTRSSSSPRPMAQSKESLRVEAPKAPFTPCNLFFYGSLMDTDILSRITGLSTPPSLSSGTISHFRMKMWGPFPTLIASQSSYHQVKGMYWKCESEEQFERLKAYETDAYTWCFCDVEMEDGGVLKGCRTFVWSGDSEDEDLTDGRFDLGEYQRTTKRAYV